ncbi:MAG TPA: vanadium-dependent haloperoxidase [Marmoricola sp.]|nr:vanadium-dependent haloperoxidase [Marmoricola sp.]
MTPAHARTTLAVLLASSVAAGSVTTATASGAARTVEEPRAAAAQVLLDWERTAMLTIYGEPSAPTTTTPIPSGVPVLGFTSVAMYDAVRRSLARANSSEAAAAASAAHGVLRTYYLGARAQLDSALEASLGDVPDGAAERVGMRIGRRAADHMVASRHHDGYGDPTFHYDGPDGPGAWQPPEATGDMLVPWLGSLRPLVLDRTVPVDGPPALTGRRYAREYDEVRRVGSQASTERTDAQTETALFFNSNSATMVGDALIRHLEAEPLTVRRTARLFAAIHAAMTDTIIRCWQLKRDVGFWRPSEAVAGAGDDGNPATEPEPGWTPLIANPPYSDYVSGHACLTAPAVEVIRRTLGEDTALPLVSVNSPTPRVYDRLRRLERQAFMARIWSGLHFRTAMEHGYRIGHRTARLVLHRLP